MTFKLDDDELMTLLQEIFFYFHYLFNALSSSAALSLGMSMRTNQNAAELGWPEEEPEKKFVLKSKVHTKDMYMWNTVNYVLM